MGHVNPSFSPWLSISPPQVLHTSRYRSRDADSHSGNTLYAYWSACVGPSLRRTRSSSPFLFRCPSLSCVSSQPLPLPPLFCWPFSDCKRAAAVVVSTFRSSPGTQEARAQSVGRASHRTFKESGARLGTLNGRWFVLVVCLPPPPPPSRSSGRCGGHSAAFFPCVVVEDVR